MIRRILTITCLLIAIIAYAQHSSSSINKKKTNLSGKRNTEYHTNTNEPNYNSENQLTDFKTYSNEVLLREASVYMDQKKHFG